MTIAHLIRDLLRMHYAVSTLTVLVGLRNKMLTCCSTGPAQCRKAEETLPALARFRVLLAITFTRTSAYQYSTMSILGLEKTNIYTVSQK